MLLFRGFFELSIFFFFLLSKEVLFYGEERLITVCYLFLFLVGFFTLYQGAVNDFNSRANSIKEELDVYFHNIINVLVQTKAFIRMSFDIFKNFLVLYKAIITEFSFYYLHFYNYSDYKRFMLDYQASATLKATSAFYTNVRKVLMKKHNTMFLYKELAAEQYSFSTKGNTYNQLLATVNKQIALKEA